MEPLTREDLKNKPADFRIGAIISDGMWYSLPKWRKLATASEEEMAEWIERKLASGDLIQADTGAKSYRAPLAAIEKWYSEQNIPLGTQLLSFIFPPRIWDGMTETEGFLNAPLRSIGIVSFSASTEVAEKVTEALLGVARVREFEPGRYKAYCLSAAYAREIIEETLRASGTPVERNIYSRSEAKRREIVDFSEGFAQNLVMFHRDFGKTLVRKEMETIRIFLPNPEDQESQILIWVLTAIEKFDESAAVPFAGYLNAVLRRWPYDLPSTHLGKELSSFQRERAKALEALRVSNNGTPFTSEDVADKIGMDTEKYLQLESSHKTWVKAQNATTLTWEENPDEKMSSMNLTGDGEHGTTDTEMAHRLSMSMVEAALATGLYKDAFMLIEQVDNPEMSEAIVESVSPEYVKALGRLMGNQEQ